VENLAATSPLAQKYIEGKPVKKVIVVPGPPGQYRAMRRVPRSSQIGAGALAVMLAACMLLVAGCGFHLSRPPELPFATLYVSSAASYSNFGAELRRYLASTSNTQLVDRREQGEITLHIITELVESQILALSVAGRVNELQVRYRLSFSVRDRENHEWIAPTEILLHRDMTYDDQTGAGEGKRVYAAGAGHASGCCAPGHTQARTCASAVLSWMLTRMQFTEK
jgi:LPS-assembly lipoprotein